MAFSEEAKDEVFNRCGRRCECKRQHVGITGALYHGGRCVTTFSRHGNWEAHHITAVSVGGNDVASNCEALCLSCNKLTQ
jgi:5-methylcytosine-specific restriction endonuclease McrA